MKLLILIVLIVSFASFGLAQDQNKKSEKNPSRLKFSETSKVYHHPAKKPPSESTGLNPIGKEKSASDKLSIIENYPVQKQKVKAQPAMGKASTSGPPQEMKKMNVQNTVSKEEILKLQGKSESVTKKAQK
jgi:hypothetical protein